GRHAGQLGPRLLRAAGILRRRPDRALGVGDLRRRVHGLHARVLEERHLVHGLDDLAGAQGLVDVAVVARDLTRLLRGLRVLPVAHGRRDLRERSVVPWALERATSLHRRPEGVGAHGHAVRDLDDLLHALDRARGGRVEALHLAAVDRTALDRRDEHAG